MKALFELDWSDDSGPDWMTAEKLDRCIHSPEHYDPHVRCDVTRVVPVTCRETDEQLRWKARAEVEAAGIDPENDVAWDDAYDAAMIRLVTERFRAWKS